MRLRFIFVGSFFIFMLIYAVVSAYSSFIKMSEAGTLGWRFMVSEEKGLVTLVRPDGPASVLRNSDEVVSINDQEVNDYDQYSHLRRGLHMGSSYQITIKRGGRPETFTLSVAPISVSGWIVWGIQYLFIPTVNFVVGFIVFLFRPHDKRALLLALMLVMIFGSLQSQSIIPRGTISFFSFFAVFGTAVTRFVCPVILHFSLIFPESPAWLRRHRWFEVLIYLPWLLIGLPYFLYQGILIITGSERLYASVYETSWSSITATLAVLYVIATLLSLIIKYCKSDSLVRRKIRVAIIGFAAGVLPLTLLVIAYDLLKLPLKFNLGWELMLPIEVIAYFAPVLIPISLSYVIVRHRVIPVTLLIRLSIRYALVSHSFLAIRILVAGVFIYLVLDTLFHYLKISIAIEIGVCIALVSIGLWELFKRLHYRYLSESIQKRYFRRSYDAERLPTEIGRALQGMVDMKAMATLVTSKICEVFQTENAAMFLREGTADRYVCTSLYPDEVSEAKVLTSEFSIPGDAFIVEQLGKSVRPFEVSPDNLNAEQGWASQFERGMLQSLRSELLLPVITKNQVVGIISIAPRLGEIPFSAKDKATLVRLAENVAYAMEVAMNIKASSELSDILKEVTGSPDFEHVLRAAINASIKAVAPAEKGSLFLWDEETQQLIVRAQIGFSDDLVDKMKLGCGEGYAGWVFAHGTPLNLKDVWKFEETKDVGDLQVRELRSAICVPLEAWGLRIGVLCLDNISRGDAFQDSDLERLSAFGGQVALAIQNTRLHSELYNLGLEINSGELDRQRIFDRVVQGIVKLTEARAANLLLLRDTHNPELSVKQKPLLSLAYGLGDDYSGKVTPRPDGLTFNVLRQRKALWVSNPDISPGIHPLALEKGVQACICFPLELSEFEGGVFFVHYVKEHQFSETEIKLLSLFATQAALAINNAQQRAELELTDQVAWMGLMFPSLAHKITQRMGQIRYSVATLEKLCAGNEEASRSLSRIREATEKLKEIRRESLSLPFENEVVDVSLNDMLRRDISEWCRAHPEIELDFGGLAADDTTIHVDRKRFGIVLEILATNAVRATQTAKRKKITVESQSSGRKVIVNISNTGEPIPSSVISKLFRGVIRADGRRGAGAGAGLLIAKRIIRRYGGDLELVKSDNSGTTFSFWLDRHLKEEDSIGIRGTA